MMKAFKGGHRIMDNGYILVATVIDSKVGIGFEMYGWHRCHGRFQISDDESQAEIYDYMDEAERDRDMFLEAVRSRFPGDSVSVIIREAE
jgi:hypothetical protein